jgi:hypothetical protein
MIISSPPKTAATKKLKTKNKKKTLFDFKEIYWAGVNMIVYLD